MNNILLATDFVDLRDRFRAATGQPIPALPPGPLPAGPAQLFQLLEDGAVPEVVVIDERSGTEAALELATRLNVECPGIAVVLVSDRAAELGLGAMRAGVSDIVPTESDEDEIRQALDRALRVTRQRSPAGQGDGADPGQGSQSGRGRVLSVVSPKGGVGKTTIATNLAVGLARSEPHSTVLVDLDLQFGDVANALNLSPEHTLVDVVQGVAARDSMVLKTFLTQHETGLAVVCGPHSPAEADLVGVEELTHLLQTLASEFRYVVIDTAPALTDHTLAALDLTDDLVLLTSMDVPGVRGLRKELDILRDLGMAFERRHVVVNFADTHSGLTRSDVEATIGTGVDLVLPRSRAAAVSMNQGVPLLLSEARDPMTKKLRHLVDRFTPAPMRDPRPAKATAGPGFGGRHRLRRKGAQ
ncbi:AAA family ATPase [Dietzia sp. PP-33]|jgi:pilus assembly protein CpaE|uniref:AAA family ATPase n=1 Tax=Dietzia sp. PP-33 TaxID=2957500 RepID=UPI0029B81654|nr:AAA family ATPase [Dietzia sp. PP-33]MDX2356287.1 AAA family ATPase [Dietzia sp. PP-33]